MLFKKIYFYCGLLLQIFSPSGSPSVASLCEPALLRDRHRVTEKRGEVQNGKIFKISAQTGGKRWGAQTDTFGAQTNTFGTNWKGSKSAQMGRCLGMSIACRCRSCFVCPTHAQFCFSATKPALNSVFQLPHIYFWSDFRISNALWLERILRYCISWNVNTERGIMNIKEVIPLQKAFLCIIYCL